MTDYGRIMREIEAEKMEDVVNHPKHYNQSGVECIDAIKAATGDGMSTTCKETSSSICGDTDIKTVSKTLKKQNGILKN